MLAEWAVVVVPAEALAEDSVVEAGPVVVLAVEPVVVVSAEAEPLVLVVGLVVKA